MAKALPKMVTPPMRHIKGVLIDLAVIKTCDGWEGISGHSKGAEKLWTPFMSKGALVGAVSEKDALDMLRNASEERIVAMVYELRGMRW
jgi:hypothetical protein